MPDRLRKILQDVQIAAVVVAGLLLLVWPFAESMLDRTEHVLLAVGASLTVGVGTGLRLGRQSGIGLGFGIGLTIGILAAILLSILPGRSEAAVVLPIVGLGIGFIDGIGAERLGGLRESLLVSLVIGGLVGLAALAAIGWAGFFEAGVGGLFVGSVASLRNDPDGRWRGGLRRPPVHLVVLDLLLIAAAFALVIFDPAKPLESWWQVPAVVAIVVLYPLVGFALGHLLAVWGKPRLQVYRELLCYLRVMWVPMGAFALGFSVIILLFAGFYGTLHKYAGTVPFDGVDQPAVWDWVFYSFLTATTMGSENVIPISRPAQALVALETIAGLSWIIIMFAAVMTHLQPQLEQIARNAAAEDAGADSARTDSSGGRR